MVDGVQSAFVSDLCISSSRGTALRVYYGAVGFASIFSGAIAGMLWQSKGPEITFLYGIVAGAPAVLALQTMKRP